MSIKHTSIVGNMTTEPKLRFVNNGQAVADFGLAVNNRRRNDQGQWEDSDPEFFDVTLWGSLAENAAVSLEKGTRVLIIGELRFRSWTDSETKQKRSRVNIVAEAIGPDLKWATAEVTRITKSTSRQEEPTIQVADSDEEPFS